MFTHPFQCFFSQPYTDVVVMAWSRTPRQQELPRFILVFHRGVECSLFCCVALLLATFGGVVSVVEMSDVLFV
jgi:hypothetical protein